MLHWRFTEACSLHYPLWKKFETTRTLPRAGLLAKLSNWWRRGLVILVTKNLMVTLVELHDHICRGEKPTEGQTSLQHSTDLGFMAVWPNSILSSVNTHENTHGICKKAPKGPSDSEKQDSLVWWTSILSIMFETSSAHRLQSIIPKVKCAGSSLMLGLLFSGRDWGTRQSRRKAQCTKNIEIALMKTQSRAFRTSVWAEGSLSNRTMTLSTQQEWLIDNSVNVLEWPSQSLGLNPIKYFWRNTELRVWILMQCTYFSFFICNKFAKLSQICFLLCHYDVWSVNWCGEKSYLKQFNKAATWQNVKKIKGYE